MCFRLPLHYLLFFACCRVSVSTESNWHFKGVNIALGKTATQGPDTFSETPSSGMIRYYTADLAVDGNTSGNFYDLSCTHTTGSSSVIAYWEVDLQKAYKITGIRIYNRNGFQKRLEHFIIYGNGSIVIYNSQGTDEFKKDVIDISLNGTLYYSYIKVQLPAKDWDSNIKHFLTLCEVEIFAATCAYRNITKGEIEPNQQLYEVNTQARILCNEGFKPKVQNITCKVNKTWSSYTKCSRVRCPSPGELVNGHYIKNSSAISRSSSLPYGSVITVRCDLGYRSEKTQNRTCQFDETWSGEAPLCTKTQCSYPEGIANGEYQLQDTSIYESGSSYYNTTIQVLCNTGYKIDGEKKRTCNANQTWSGEAKCSLVTCPLPRVPAGGFYGIKGSNGSFIPYNKTKSNYSYEIHAICPKGYFLNSTSIVRRCLESELWSGEQGTCVLVTCGHPEEIQNGFYNYTKELSPERVPYNTVMTAVCDEHFELVNPDKRERRCTVEGIWDNEPALCVKIQTHTGINKSALVGGTVSATGLIISATLVALLVIYCRRRRPKDNTGRSLRYRNNKTESRITNTSSSKHADGHHSNAVDISQDESKAIQTRRQRLASHARDRNRSYHPYPQRKDTSIETSRLDKTSGGPGMSPEYSNAVPVQLKLADPSLRPLQSDGEYYSFSGTKRIPVTAIKIHDLADIPLSGTGAKERFQKEFESLPQGMVEAHKAALKPQNRRKNRYKKLYAYDDTRVILDVEDEPDSDYINACFVHGFNRTREYIASQGPTKEILNDFWRMIWQTKCCKIVMLTKLVEEEKVKCEQYWPSQGSQTYGRITVKVKQTEPFSQFVMRTFTVQKDGSSVRNVTQFHFTAWPDRGVPKYASSMVQFLSKVKHFPSQGDGPIVVHCSAGVGRTGTFIALDNVTEQGKAMGYVDVAGVVESMRKQRVRSVQTLEQYIFLYQAVTETLMLSSSAMPAAKFPEAYTELLQTDPRKKKRKLVLEFEALKRMLPITGEDQYVSSKCVRNRSKNRYTNVLPVEEYMPRLTNGDGTEDCEYINAVFLPSYKEEKAFIITQTPLESTVEDFWRLIWEHDVHTLIMMNKREEMTNSEVYWPSDDQTVSVGNISITNDGTSIINKHAALSLSVKKFGMSRPIRLFQVGGWKSNESLPESTDVILSLMELVQGWQQQTGNHTILVHCMNGVEKNGLFCVISAVIERMKIEQNVAIPQVIEEMRNAREQIIPTLEQFQFCHEAVLAFIHQYDTYSNFAI